MVSTSRVYLHCQVIIHQRRVLDRQRIQPNVCRREGGGEDRSCAERKGNLARKEISQERKSHKKGNLARTEISQERKSHRWPLSEKKWILANCCPLTSRHVHSNVLTYTASVKKLLLLGALWGVQELVVLNVYAKRG